MEFISNSVVFTTALMVSAVLPVNAGFAGLAITAAFNLTDNLSVFVRMVSPAAPLQPVRLLVVAKLQETSQVSVKLPADADFAGLGNIAAVHLAHDHGCLQVGPVGGRIGSLVGRTGSVVGRVGLVVGRIRSVVRRTGSVGPCVQRRGEMEQKINGLLLQ